MSSYRGVLAADEQPSVWVTHYPTVALVTFEKAADAKWNFSAPASFIYTPWLVKIDEYIKGAGAGEQTVALLGGTVGDTQMVLPDQDVDVQAGQSAVVFLTATGKGMAGATVDNAYVIDGDIARSGPDDRAIATGELLAQLRQAAKASAPSQ